MIEIDIHEGHPKVNAAIKNLEEQIKLFKRQNKKAVCVITGYGSTGGSHKIKTAAIEYLNMQKGKLVKDYILGENIDIFSEIYQKFTYKELIDEKMKNKHNRGTIVIILWGFMDNFRIVKAKKKDAGIILDLIKEIASYEHMENDVCATVKSIKKSIFKDKRAFVSLAMLNDKVIGYILYFYNYSTFTGSCNIYLEDIYLKEEYRHNGFGKEMFKYLATEAKKINAKRIDFVCLDWNEPSLKFYNKLGAKRLDYWVLHRLDEKTINDLSEV